MVRIAGQPDTSARPKLRIRRSTSSTEWRDDVEPNPEDCYCKALVDKCRTVTGSTQNAQTVAVAMEQCAKDNASAAIPALEKSLQEQKATLPPRS